ncbi:MAG: cobalamin-dependent protein [Solirubrobacteraceae bacterium]
MMTETTDADRAAAVERSRPIRVVVSKVGLDGHDRGAKVIAQGLRDRGMEVVYAGLRRTPAELAQICLQEDASVLGLSILSGAVVPLTRKVREATAALGLEDLLIVVGGITSPEIVSELNELGIEGAFGPGTTIGDVVEFIEANVTGATL